MKKGIKEDKTYVFLQELTDRVLGGNAVSLEEAEKIAGLSSQVDIVSLMSFANMVRNQFHGGHINRCAIVNARSGTCSEDCRFCAQSAAFATGVETYPLLAQDEMVRAADEAAEQDVHRFSIVTSGRGAGGKKAFEEMCAAIAEIARKGKVLPCASLGILNGEEMGLLREAGLKRYHHNLETAGSFFPEVCTTHSFEDRTATIRAAHDQGLEVCAGGILGLGESVQQRIEMAFQLRELEVVSVPLNFLSPIKGTPLEHMPGMGPLEILKYIALYRFVLPGREIRICGGRERNLKTLQPLMYIAGANGVMVGNYLTTSGRSIDIDIEEIHDLGLL